MANQRNADLKNITAWVPSKDAEEIRAAAEAENRTVSNLLKVAIREYLDRRAGKK